MAVFVFTERWHLASKETVLFRRKMPWYVYCLQTVEPPYRTYVGATVDLDRRLAQHNGEQKGGAKATAARPAAWMRVCHVSGFLDNHQALSFEWHWKRFSRGKGREEGLEKCLAWAKEKFPGLSLSLQYET